MKDPSNPVCRTISTLLSRIGDKWTVLVVQTLGEGPKRFNELRREIPSVSQRMATTAQPDTGSAQEATNKPTIAKGWGTDAPDQPLRPMEFERRALRPNDVAIKITYAGICHSDLHTCRNDWGGTRYPVIPGHDLNSQWN